MIGGEVLFGCCFLVLRIFGSLRVCSFDPAHILTSMPVIQEDPAEAEEHGGTTKPPSADIPPVRLDVFSIVIMGSGYVYVMRSYSGVT